ncbi:Spo0E family sporulation regulatory protein-aspartic acid phosphatase [Gracilibacillus alcaliphilus]|uniref:Spo0E family sporulation regulatory protein-aspartic acid phosphatase n=1 Tax=Gracilibacillus alcaliphilus TaxID=1401441 RepID=UPI00195732D2|nr:Spo0E family sporulation regulatory protein-aspartic acid phosphatase [Gracilibacillus alcaliphilus]MBM7677890.1 hypothetical protein [Gracilibacillus alcaliphilus]
MKDRKLEAEIHVLKNRLYQLGQETTQYSNGEILKVSELLDDKIIQYQKLRLKKKKATQ